ncbi:uncharacterized protein [Glycine max]|uniref:Uncharacterized protein n=1 Tax=Glycine max TaxID=3847 RepID=C6TGQ3_SOYBN|nr:uncharacterized protein LOC121172791 [Glycine max]ACU21005.1 unknown [Glycine max]
MTINSKIGTAMVSYIKKLDISSLSSTHNLSLIWSWLKANPHNFFNSLCIALIHRRA